MRKYMPGPVGCASVAKLRIALRVSGTRARGNARSFYTRRTKEISEACLVQVTKDSDGIKLCKPTSVVEKGHVMAHLAIVHGLNP